ncbi:hypothetical protein FXO38_10342 [Capsicum annuum]|nr:hypothetical protein FXO37_25411 [Capsicum annuum]KAF3664031.1 hypothetical protein FXO38_10342 [Capsicum annuum]
MDIDVMMMYAKDGGYFNVMMVPSKFERGIIAMMMPRKAGGYIDDMLMIGKDRGYIDVMMMLDKDGGYIDDMLMPDKVGGYIDVMIMFDKSKKGIDAIKILGKPRGYIDIMLMQSKITVTNQVNDGMTNVPTKNIATSSRSNAAPAMAPVEKPKKFSGLTIDDAFQVAAIIEKLPPL